MANTNLASAKRAKNDEFYTQFPDIQKEMEAYLEYDPETFRNKVVYCNCDDPFESNFFRYFALNFKRLGLKRLITTSYKPSPVANTQLGLFGDDITLVPEKGRPKVTANKLVINDVGDMDDDGAFNLNDVAEQLKANKHNEWTPLEGDGDFRSEECVKLLRESDIVVTNPPFSLFREYVGQLMEHNKKFIIIGNMNAITYKEIFPLIKDNEIWLGLNNFDGSRFYLPSDSVSNGSKYWEVLPDGRVQSRVSGVRWFTNVDHGRRHQRLSLMSANDNLKFNKKLTDKNDYDTYDNYDAIEVPYVDAIPSDYEGVMGVPISFLDKYSPEQFIILGITDRENIHGMRTKVYTRHDSPKYNDLNRRGAIKSGTEYIATYARILIKHRKATV